MEGYLGKRGKRIGSRVKRYMRLDGPLLSNHHTPSEPPTWTVNIKHAKITCNLKRNRIVLELFNNKLDLFADTLSQCEQWYDALTVARSQANLEKGNHEKSGDSDYRARFQPSIQDNVNVTTVSGFTKEEERRQADLGKFKVVKPSRSTATGSMRSNDSDEFHTGDQLEVNGQAYEETPASMIFKQFNFPK